MELRKRDTTPQKRNAPRASSQKVLIISDIHLSANPANEYRWELFPLLTSLAKEYGVKHLWCLGDLTDAKDRHPGEFVNRMTDAFLSLPFEDIEILKGNHDYSRNGEPFFRFLSRFPAIRYYSSPVLASRFGLSCHFLPHTSDGDAILAALETSTADILLLHHTFDGAAAGSAALHGTNISSVKSKGRLILSGDVHIPQKVGPVEYVGAPYHQTFGDSFSPRVLLLEIEDKKANLFPISTEGYFPSKETVVAATAEQLEKKLSRIAPGSHVRVRLSIEKSDFRDFESMRSLCQTLCQELGLVLFGVEVSASRKVLPHRGQPTYTHSTVPSTFSSYCSKHQLPDAVKAVGTSMLSEVI
jgi:predicted phosphodiesterase